MLRLLPVHDVVPDKVMYNLLSTNTYIHMRMWLKLWHVHMSDEQVVTNSWTISLYQYQPNIMHYYPLGHMHSNVHLVMTAHIICWHRLRFTFSVVLLLDKLFANNGQIFQVPHKNDPVVTQEVYTDRGIQTPLSSRYTVLTVYILVWNAYIVSHGWYYRRPEGGLQDYRSRQ